MLKTFIALLILMVSSTLLKGQTQQQMNQKVYEEYVQVDKRLNETYRKIIKQYQADTLFIEKLKISQRLWIKLRDANLEMKFPGANKNVSYGSIYPLCEYALLKELTELRITYLNTWLNGVVEGDMCSGSIKLN